MSNSILEEKTKSKRGRKKKWETSDLKNYSLNTCNSLEFLDGKNKDSTKDGAKDHAKDMAKDSNYQALNFGNLTIKVQEKEEKPSNIIFLNKDKKTKCTLDISDEEDETNYKVIKKIKHVTDTNKPDNLRCYYCHNFFENKPFYIPLKYSEILDRYKLFGNFCSPNCAKSYCMSNKILESKLYLLSQFYRKLFGPDFKISPAPNFLKLKEYGGNLTIEEFRKFSYTNNKYILSNVSCEVIFLNY
jgi:hypothetical protein